MYNYADIIYHYALVSTSFILPLFCLFPIIFVIHCLFVLIMRQSLILQPKLAYTLSVAQGNLKLTVIPLSQLPAVIIILSLCVSFLVYLCLSVSLCQSLKYLCISFALFSLGFYNNILDFIFPTINFIFGNRNRGCLLSKRMALPRMEMCQRTMKVPRLKGLFLFLSIVFFSLIMF